MENKKRMPATVLAQMEVFDYLKEKVGERKTRTEAYCDLLDKAMAGFVSSYLRRQDYELPTWLWSGAGTALPSVPFWTRWSRLVC